MLDHIGFAVSDLEKSRLFYKATLAPLGYELIMEVHGYAGFGAEGKADFWIHQGTPATHPLHVSFRSKDRASVRAFHKAAIDAGGKDNGAPGIRKIYHPNYYGAFVLDLDGLNIEAVCHVPE